MPDRLALQPGSRRLAAGLFAGLILLFVLLSQANLWFHVGAGGFPGPDQVLWKYDGKPGTTKLHQVLDPSRPKDDPRAMWPYLGDSPAVQDARRQEILAWVDRGAPREGWAAVAPVFLDTNACAQCHAPGGLREDMPFDTYERVRAVAEPDAGMPWGLLYVSAHNHLFAFGVAALLLSVLLTFTGLGGLPRVLLILAAFGGPVIDVGSWFLTKIHGAPWHFGVMLGGGLFGGAIAAMALVVLWEAFLARPKPPAA
jgi:hypothetical protein